MGEGLFDISSGAGLVLLVCAVVLLAILVISFRSRPIVFCQYLHAMTGVTLKPAQVKAAFDSRGREGVRELFLELIIRQDLQDGPLEIPEAAAPGGSGTSAPPSATVSSG